MKKLLDRIFGSRPTNTDLHVHLEIDRHAIAEAVLRDLQLHAARR